MATQRITIGDVTLLCNDKAQRIIKNLLGVQSLGEVTNDPTGNNIEITFEALNRPFKGDTKHIVCHVPEMELMTTRDADLFFFNRYGCYFSIAAWLFRNGEIYKEYTEYENATYIGSGEWLEKGLTLAQNDDRRKLVEIFASVDRNGCFSDADSIAEFNNVMSLESALEKCVIWDENGEFFKDYPNAKTLYNRYVNLYSRFSPVL